MKNSNTEKNIYLIFGVLFYILTIWFIFNNYSTRYFILTGIIANLLLFKFKNINNRDKDTDNIIK